MPSAVVGVRRRAREPTGDPGVMSPHSMPGREMPPARQTPSDMAQDPDRAVAERIDQLLDQEHEVRRQAKAVGRAMTNASRCGRSRKRSTGCGIGCAAAGRCARQPKTRETRLTAQSVRARTEGKEGVHTPSIGSPPRTGGELAANIRSSRSGPSQRTTCPGQAASAAHSVQPRRCVGGRIARQCSALHSTLPLRGGPRSSSRGTCQQEPKVRHLQELKGAPSVGCTSRRDWHRWS